jgi:hypothetical protein
VVVGVGALIFAYLAWRVSKKQLRLAQEQAERRPRLVVSFREVAFHYRPPDPSSQYVRAAIVFNITNSGRSAAHNVTCEIRLEEQHLVPDDMHGPNRDFSAARLGPSVTTVHSVNVGIRFYGPTNARYRCTCDEVGEVRGVIEFNVPEKGDQ